MTSASAYAYEPARTQRSFTSLSPSPSRPPLLIPHHPIPAFPPFFLENPYLPLSSITTALNSSRSHRPFATSSSSSSSPSSRTPNRRSDSLVSRPLPSSGSNGRDDTNHSSSAFNFEFSSAYARFRRTSPEVLPALQLLAAALSVWAGGYCWLSFASPPSSSSGETASFIDELQFEALQDVRRNWLAFGSSSVVAASSAALLLSPRLPPLATIAALLLPIVGGALLQYLLLHSFSGGSGSQVALSLGCVPLDPHDPRQLRVHQMVTEMAATAQLPALPKLYLWPSAVPNAFAAGLSSRDAALAVSQGLLHLNLSDAELRAVLGHELGHIVHGDSRSGTHLAVMLLAYVGTYSSCLFVCV